MDWELIWWLVAGGIALIILLGIAIVPSDEPKKDDIEILRIRGK